MKELICILFFLPCIGFSQETNFTELQGSYFGQKPPGIEPEIFLPGILNNEKAGAFCSIFSPDGNEFYFTGYEKKEGAYSNILAMKKTKNVWTKPEVVSFNSLKTENDLCMSADGSRIIFRSWRALPDGTFPENHSFLWFTERVGEKWSEAKPLLFGDTPLRTGYPSIANNGTLYFSHKRDTEFGIFCSKIKNGKYNLPKHVVNVHNTIYTEGDLFVDPNENYLIISCWDHPENIDGPKGDLYIVYKNVDGLWSEAINMGVKINTECGENCPTISPDGKYLFFNRYCEKTTIGNIYWVSAKVIEELKPKDLK